MQPNEAAALIPLDVLYSACFGYVNVKERWQSLALVSRAWRVAALASVKALRHLDLVHLATSLMWKAAHSILDLVSWGRPARTCGNTPFPIHGSIAINSGRGQVRMLLMPLADDGHKTLWTAFTRVQLTSIRLYGPRVTKATLSGLLCGVDPLQFHCIVLESKQADAPEFLLLTQCRRLRTLHLNCIKLTDNGILL
ncbi:hypothetical protein DYB32_000076 [Aphanomyces invadans]|uniref:Uncharacterized protein n=1 Tax=Aphanomyces invadans TaxID=157072 RepID=A0A418BB05_9STRA|nr:hypothetical protein DYB32_000076 [Aphanomyces invadans]